MEKYKIYRTNILPALVILLMIFVGFFSIDIDKLLNFYNDARLLTLFFFAFILLPVILFFGFRFYFFKDKIIYRYNIFFRKILYINYISHVLYQPTWRGIVAPNSPTKIRSLHIVEKTGGLTKTISLANGAFKEEDLADIAQRLQQINSRIELDVETKALIKRYESSIF